MLEGIDLSRKVKKAEFKAAKGALDIHLGELQRKARELGVPVIVAFEGWSTAGKGALINELILPLDSRGYKVYSAPDPCEEERRRPFLWPFWRDTPARGRIAIFNRSWYRRVLGERIDGSVRDADVHRAYEDIRAFERQLTDDGNVVVKFLLHISKHEQKRRLRKLRASSATAWRVMPQDLRNHERYDDLLAAADDMLGETDTENAPWTVVEAEDQKFATLKIFRTVVAALERAVTSAEARRTAETPHAGSAPQKAAHAAGAPFDPAASVLDRVDLTAALGRAEYEKHLKKAQERLRALQYEILFRRLPVVVMYDGWDAAGKGGNIRRLVQHLDPRNYVVVPVGAPNDVEKAHHYLWRFWVNMPEAGHITIFDRSWYGRVLVERVEGLCTEDEWRRAYREINEMEAHLTNFGTVLLKFWLHIDPAEQLRRFRERQRVPYKHWKITEDDWRNRRKWPEYRPAVEEMLVRTSTPDAPWYVVPSECKCYARVKVIEAVCRAVERKL